MGYWHTEDAPVKLRYKDVVSQSVHLHIPLHDREERPIEIAQISSYKRPAAYHALLVRYPHSTFRQLPCYETNQPGSRTELQNILVSQVIRASLNQIGRQYLITGEGGSRNGHRLRDPNSAEAEWRGVIPVRQAKRSHHTRVRHLQREQFRGAEERR